VERGGERGGTYSFSHEHEGARNTRQEASTDGCRMASESQLPTPRDCKRHLNMKPAPAVTTKARLGVRLRMCKKGKGSEAKGWERNKSRGTFRANESANNFVNARLGNY
jgi:hypothetical protein